MESYCEIAWGKRFDIDFLVEGKLQIKNVEDVLILNLQVQQIAALSVLA